MRYSERVDLVVEEISKYNPLTKKKEVTQKAYSNLPCNVNRLSRERTQLDFGEMAKDVSVVRLPKQLKFEPTYVLLKGRKYKVIDIRVYDHSTSLFISEVLSNAI
ncbi:minor head protein [Staphylococcus phage 187]|uniref:ORF107 n=1 Tax=Staphylococcus phage 187 TaxID=2908096 RepID=Q4ZE30_9CAUD|nr:minor head protein [Staphylococcus phage 187]AAX90748.1 ORF107 [Staphylococcus phage 187]